MRPIIAILLCILLTGSSATLQAEERSTIAAEITGTVSAEETAKTLLYQSELAIVGKNGGGKDEDFRYRMGESLLLRVTGAAAARVGEALARASGPRTITLILDGVRMANLNVGVLEIEPGKHLFLDIHLVRNPHDHENRTAWDTFFSKQHSYLMRPSVALAIGNNLPEPVSSARTFQFYIASITAVISVLGIGILAFLATFYGLVKNPSILRDEKDGQYSLGKSQMAFWGLLVMLTFVGVWLLTGTMERIPPQVLILLGISGTTGLGAVVIGENKKTAVRRLQEEQHLLESKQNDTTTDRLAVIRSTLKKLTESSQPASSAGFWRDICDDGNGMSFHRLQVVLWTIVLGIVFVWSVAQALSMPEFSETLLVLMGISNGTYLGFKIPERP